MRELTGALARDWEPVEIWRDVGDGTDGFGNAESSWSEVGSTVARRSYPNRNTTVQEQAGSLDRNRPVFFFPAGNAPLSGERIKFRGDYYEVEAPTAYETHVSMMADEITDFTP
jgi:hypothetical protein